jgi:hypothetical protein
MITAGMNEKAGGAINRSADPLADFVRTFGFTRVVSTGTFLDSLRFRFHVARRLRVERVTGRTYGQAPARPGQPLRE